MQIPDSIRDKLYYDKTTGKFQYYKPMGKAVGRDQAGNVDKRGYRYISYKGRRYKAARLAWWFVTGEWPSQEIDHADRDRDNNAWSNLRPASRAENLWNRGQLSSNTSGCKGVDFKRGKWRSRISIPGKGRIELGYFHSMEEAYRAYCEAAELHHGDFKCVG